MSINDYDYSYTIELTHMVNLLITFQVGPVPQGILRHDAVKKTDSALHALLDYFQRQNDGEDLQKELEQVYPNGLVPCYRTAPARRPGEISGKITWPSDPENPNFPALMVHESLQDKDFSLLKVGDPLFVAPDRSVIYYDGSHGTSIHLPGTVFLLVQNKCLTIILCHRR